jgi:hypothetical protein
MKRKFHTKRRLKLKDKGKRINVIRLTNFGIVHKLRVKYNSPFKVVIHFKFDYQSLKIYNMPPQVFKTVNIAILFYLSVKSDGILNTCVSREFFFM